MQLLLPSPHTCSYQEACLNQLLRGNPVAAASGEGFGLSKSTPAFMKLSSTPMDIKVSCVLTVPPFV